MNAPFDQFAEARQYLARVVPWPEPGEVGYINIHYKYKAPGRDKFQWRGYPAANVSQAIGHVARALRNPNATDIYACLSSQRMAEQREGPNGPFLVAARSQENALKLKSLFIDLDAKGQDKNSYDSPDDAVTALGNFIRDTGLPGPTMVVASGGGFHVYWCLMRALTVAEWQPLANALAEATRRCGLKCDTACTVDAARILRVPNTFNYKTDTPGRVRLVGRVRDFDYAIERIEKALEPYKVQARAPAQSVNSYIENPSLFPPRPPLAADDLSAGITARSDVVFKIEDVAAECPWIRYTLATGGKDNSNPLWNISNLISVFLEDGRAKAHEMGNQHRAYTPKETDEQYDRKVREHQEKGIGWPSCQSIVEAGCTHCAGCAHVGQGKSPLHFARKTAPPTQPPTASPSDLPEGYTRNSRGLVCRLTQDESGATREVIVLDYPLDDPWLQADPWVIHFSTTVERGRKKQISIPFDKVGTSEMRAHVQSQGLALPIGKGLEEVTRFIMSWIKKLQESRDSVSSAPFGWHVKNAKLEGFVFGNQLWTPAGPQPAANPDTVIARHYAPSGELQPWIEAAKLITAQGRQDLAAIVASAFGAPLVRFTGQPGVLMSAYSTESGIGKSTALRVAQATWGDPVRAVQSLSDTQNAVMGKLGEIRSLPLYWDELKTEEDTKKFVNITFQVTQGKEKARMTQRATQREPGSWQTLLVSASNDSLLDFVINQTNTTTAGIYRIFEYAVKPADANTPGQVDPSQASLMIARLNDNHGAAGLKYAQFLGANHTRVAKEVEEFLREIGKEVQTIADERFWIALITCICVGAKFANELGLTEFDEAALKAFMLDVLEKMRAERAAQTVDLTKDVNVSTILGQFLNAMRSRHTLFTNRIHISRGKPAPGTIQIKRDATRLESVLVHVGEEDKLMRVSAAALSEWLKTKGYSRHLLTEAFEKELGMKKVVGRIGSGTQFAGATEYLLQFDLAGTNVLNFIDEA